MAAAKKAAKKGDGQTYVAETRHTIDVPGVEGGVKIARPGDKVTITATDVIIERG